MKKLMIVFLSLTIVVLPQFNIVVSSIRENKNYEIVYETLKNHDEKCELTIYSDNSSIGNYIDTILNKIKTSGQYGELLYNEVLIFSPFINNSTYKNNQYILDITISFQYYETKVQFLETWKVVRTIIEENNLRNLSKKEQVSFIYDYIASNTTYDYDFKAISQSAYSCLVLHNSVCVGISKAFDMFMIELGVDGCLVDETIEGHMYNKIYVNNKEYYCDITWDLDEPDGNYKWFMTETDTHL